MAEDQVLIPGSPLPRGSDLSGQSDQIQSSMMALLKTVGDFKCVDVKNEKSIKFSEMKRFVLFD